jgi:hypothetical protein
MTDCEQLGPTKKGAGSSDPESARRDDLGGMCSDLFGRVNVKIAIFLLIFGIFIFSDLFIENVLSRVKDATDADTTTTKGTMIQLMAVVIFYLIIDLLVQCKVV